jgi:type I restriction enzyme S subunit
MSSVVLPEGWCNACLDDVATWGSGGTPSRKNMDFYGGDIPWVKTGDLGARVLTEASEFITKEAIANSSAKIFRKGSVIMAMYGATIGRTSILGIDATTNQACAVGSPVANVTTTEFLYYFLSSEKNAFIAKGKGGAQPNISQALIKEHGIALPPLAEQKVIAEKLDELLAQVDILKTRLTTIPTLLKRFRQSVLAAAVSGKLTEEWRSDNPPLETAYDLKVRWLKEREYRFDCQQQELIESGAIKKAKKIKHPSPPDVGTITPVFPKEWECLSVSEFAECLDNLRVPVKKDERQVSVGLYPYFGANGEVDRVDEFIFNDDLVMVTEDETFYGREKPIAYRYSGKCWVNNHVHVLKAPTKIANDYLCFSLMYFNVIPWLTGTTGRAKLTQGALNVLPIGLPPEHEQTEIVRRVEQLFAFADQIEQQVKNAQSRVNNLTQSILAKAFRGELTADWRAANPDLITGENSAQALLAKIKAERDKPKKMTKQQAMFSE